MDRPTHAATLIAVLAVAACGTPEQRCDHRYAAEYRNLSALLQEVDDNLIRGYAWSTQATSGTGLRFCGGYYSPRDGFGWGYGSCYGGPDIVRTRVPIDPQEEARKREFLLAKMSALSRRDPQYCQDRYGAAD